MANTSLHLRRIQQEIKEFQQNPSNTFHAEPLKDELHVWHFTIKGPSETEFEGGIYHGKIELPFDYPLKPPALYFLTPSGRYETNTKICLTITDYHPEHWNPGWTIKTMLKALISYFPEKEGHTGVGALEYSVDERKRLAVQSRKWVCPACGPIASLVSDKEEEKQPEETKTQAEVAGDEEVPVELAGEERPQEEESEEESSESEESKHEIPRNKHNIEEITDKKTVYQYHKDESSKNVMEIDLQYLQSALMQHIMYYEAKQSVRYQRNVLNVEKPPEEVKAPENTEAQNVADSNKTYTAEQLEEMISGKDNENSLGEEVDQKERERRKIRKQIIYINVLIGVLLVALMIVFIL